MASGLSYLQPLEINQIRQIYARAKNHETVFRNILIDLSDDNIEANYFKRSSLEEIFLKYIGVAGYETRVSDFRVGPFTKKDNLIYIINFPKFHPTKLKEDQAIILIEKSNNS